MANLPPHNQLKVDSRPTLRNLQPGGAKPVHAAVRSQPNFLPKHSPTVPETVSRSNGEASSPVVTAAQGMDTIPKTLAEERSAPLDTVFLCLKKIWEGIWVKLEPGQDPDILRLRFSAWGSRYFSSVFREVEKDEMEEITHLLTNAFSAIAETLDMCMGQLGMQKEGTDWAVINLFLEALKEPEEEVEEGAGNEGTIVPEAEESYQQGNGKGKVGARGSDDEQQQEEEEEEDDDDDDEKEEEEEEEEAEQGLKPLIRTLGSLVVSLEQLSSTLVMGKLLRL